MEMEAKKIEKLVKNDTGTIFIERWNVEKRLYHEQNEILRSVYYWSTHRVIFWNKLAQPCFPSFTMQLLKFIKFYSKIFKKLVLLFEIRLIVQRVKMSKLINLLFNFLGFG